MAEMCINSNDEDFLLALESGSKKRKVLTSSLILSDSMFQKRAAKLMKYGLLTKGKVGFYLLTDKGKNYVKDLTRRRREKVQREKEKKKASLRESDPHREAPDLWADFCWWLYGRAKRFFASHTKNPSSLGEEIVSSQEKKDVQDQDGSSWWRPK